MTATSYKGLMFILDGLGDRPAEILGGRTPLEAARTPRMDSLLERGMGALVDPLIPGVPVDTHTGTALLTGVSSRDIHGLRRGPVEAAGAGIVLKEGEVALRCNFATVEKVDGEYHIKDRRAGRLDEEVVADLSVSLRDIDLGEGILASVHPATQHRAVLHLQGSGLSADISDSDPMSGEKLTIKPFRALLSANHAAQRTAKALNDFTEFANQLLENHPLNIHRKNAGLLEANGIICRGAGQWFNIKSVLQYHHLKSALVTGDCTIAGLGRLLDYSIFTAPEFSALANTDICRKISYCLRALEDHDIVFVHIKAPDICSHDFDPVRKRGFLERFDSCLDKLDRDDLVIGIGGDHSTNSNRGEHCGDPVPSLLYSPGGRRDSCKSFGESECLRGGMGRISSNTFLLSMLNSMGRLHNFRPEDSDYYTF